MTTRIVNPGPLTRIELPYAGSFAVNLYDAIVLNAGTAKLASALADQGTEAKNQAAFGPQFVGLALEAKLATDPAGTITVGLDLVAELTCVSETHAIGELVTLDEQSGGTALEDAKVVKTTDRQAAIGEVVRIDTAAKTTALVRVLSRAVQSTSLQFPPFPIAAQQAISGAGAASLESYYTAWTSTGAQAGTLADGRYFGQLKKIQLIVDGGDLTLTPANLAGGTTITFADAGDFALLAWSGTEWVAIELGNDADGATAPVLA